MQTQNKTKQHSLASLSETHEKKNNYLSVKWEGGKSVTSSAVISGAEKRWSALIKDTNVLAYPNYVYIPGLRISGDREDIRKYLAVRGFMDAQSIENILNTAITRYNFQDPTEYSHYRWVNGNLQAVNTGLSLKDYFLQQVNSVVSNNQDKKSAENDVLGFQLLVDIGEAYASTRGPAEKRVGAIHVTNREGVPIKRKTVNKGAKSGSAQEQLVARVLKAAQEGKFVQATNTKPEGTGARVVDKFPNTTGKSVNYQGLSHVFISSRTADAEQGLMNFLSVYFGGNQAKINEVMSSMKTTNVETIHKHHTTNQPVAPIVQGIHHAHTTPSHHTQPRVSPPKLHVPVQLPTHRVSPPKTALPLPTGGRPPLPTLGGGAAMPGLRLNPLGGGLPALGGNRPALPVMNLPK